MKKIKLFLSLVLSLATVAVYAQSITVKGVITDNNGDPVPSAAVLVKGSTQGAVADLDGNYSINAPANGSLIFSSIGFVTVEVPVSGRALINVTLKDDTTMLDETIVIAYGTSSRSAFTGSASVVKSEDIAKQVATNVTSALAGSTPGVQMISSNGDPTSNASSLLIRGIGSMSASSSPLIVVDGMPYDGSISDINPADVDNISVLKDAASTAVYGHRGGNGVVLISTKKGQGDAQVKVDMKWGSNSRLIPQYDIITDPAQYYETNFKLLYNKYIYSGSYTAEQAYQTACANIFDQNNGGLGYRVYDYPAGQELIGRNFKLNPNATLGYSDGTYYYTPDDWYNEVFHNSLRQEYNVSISGASDKMHYFASAGYLNDGGIVDHSTYKRYTARINADYQAKKWAKIVTSLNYSYTEAQKPYYSSTYASSGNLFYVTNSIGPIYPLYVRNADGSIKKDQGRIVYDSNQTNFTRPSIVGNAVRDNAYDSTKYASDVLNGKFGVVLTPVEGLSINAMVGAFTENTRDNELSSKYASGSSVDGVGYTEHSREMTINQEYSANYKFNIGAQNHFDLFAGYVQMNRNIQALYAQNTHLFNPNIGELSNALAKKDLAAKSYTHKYMTQGLILRAQYDFAEKYFASASFNRNASSRFSKANRWGNFWSIGAGWLINKEDFMSGADWVDMLKLKLSYGVNGNDNLASASSSLYYYYYYPYLDQYTASYNEDTDEYSTSLAFKGNENISWEKNAALNTGIEFELFKGYFNGSVEFFSRTTKDLLYSKDVPISSGNPTSVIPVNVGSIRNIGFDTDFNGIIVNNKNFNMRWNANFSHYKNTILSLDTDLPEEGLKGGYYVYKVGGSLYNAYMYKFAGVNTDTGAAAYYFDEEDENGNVTTSITENFDEATKYDLGSILPKLYGGFGISLDAYGVDFSCQFSYQLGGKYYDGNYQSLMWTQDQTGSAMHKDLLNAWSPTNTDTAIPRLDGDFAVSQSSVDRFLISSDYLSLNNVTLGYTLPKKITQKAKISSMRIYFAGENLFVLSARKGVDPRYSMGLGSMTSGSGLNAGYYSAMRNITGGITLTF